MRNRKLAFQHPILQKKVTAVDLDERYNKVFKLSKYSPQKNIQKSLQEVKSVNGLKNHLQEVKSVTGLKNQQKFIKLPIVKSIKASQNQRYIYKQILGQGAFAKVRLAQRKSDSLSCVIKSFQKFRLRSDQKRKTILKQIQILSEIDHPYIIKLIDYYQNTDTINIVMEHFSNQSLASYMKENRPIQEETVRIITKSIALALVYLHDRKISHRDIKPENILINSKNEIKIIDLGLAMMGDHQQMIVAGTPQFMCPQLIHKKNYNPFKADIWAFGVFLYWIALGYYPQDNCKNKIKSSRKINQFTLKFPVDIHPGIQYLIERMLQNDPQLRIQAKEILLDSWIKPKNIKLEIQKLVKKSKN